MWNDHKHTASTAVYYTKRISPTIITLNITTFKNLRIRNFPAFIYHTTTTRQGFWKGSDSQKTASTNCCSCCITDSLTHSEEIAIPVLHTWANRLASLALSDRRAVLEQGQFRSLDSRWLLFRLDSNSQPPNTILHFFLLLLFLLLHSKGFPHLKYCLYNKYFSKFCQNQTLRHRVSKLSKSTIFSVLTSCWSMLMSIRLNDRRWSFAPTKSRPFSSSSKKVW